MKHLSTELIHNGNGQYYKKIAESQSVPETLPVYFSSVFAFDDVPSVDDIYEHRTDGYVYSRMKNPNADAVSEILAKAEGAEAGLVFSSGMSAIILSILAVVSAGDHIISSPVLYGGVHDFLSNELARYGVSVTFVDFLNDEIEKYIRPETKLIYTESLSNPLLEVPDYKKTADIAHKHGLLFYIDNTFATSVVVKPYKYGADLVLYSATKYLGGHSDIIGGAAVGRKDVIDRIQPKLVLYGAVLSPAESWLLARSLRTLQLRVRKHSENALAVARFLESHPKIERVYYPGLESSPSHELAKAQFEDGHFGGMLSADIRGGEKEASAVIANLGFIKFVPSLAGTATSVSYAVKTSHRAYSDEELKKAGITAGQLRFSIGLEEAEDIIAEISDALDKI